LQSWGAPPTEKLFSFSFCATFKLRHLACTAWYRSCIQRTSNWRWQPDLRMIIGPGARQATPTLPGLGCALAEFSHLGPARANPNQMSFGLGPVRRPVGPTCLSQDSDSSAI
jgi:hypothetical protein